MSQEWQEFFDIVAKAIGYTVMWMGFFFLSVKFMDFLGELVFTLKALAKRKILLRKLQKKSFSRLYVKTMLCRFDDECESKLNQLRLIRIRFN